MISDYKVVDASTVVSTTCVFKLLLGSNMASGDI